MNNETRSCEVTKCTRPFYARRWCKRHYDRWRRTGNPERIRYEPKLSLISDLDLAWLAGLLEGEGWFGLTKNKNPRAAVVVSMKDKDVIERVLAICGIGVIYTNQPGEPHHAIQYRFELYSLDAEILMTELLPFMGERRSQRIHEILGKATTRDSFD